MKQCFRMKRINIRGVVWDSCCGPRPEITLPRVAALLVVNWFCCRRDKMTYSESFHDCWRLLMDRGWPGLLDKWNGKEVELSLINGLCLKIIIVLKCQHLSRCLVWPLGSWPLQALSLCLRAVHLLQHWLLPSSKISWESCPGSKRSGGCRVCCS